MPMHDWTLVYAGIFHAFHQGWTTRIADALNGGRLPATLYALAEQQSMQEKGKRFVPDVLTLEHSDSGGVLTAPRLKKPKPKSAVAATSDLEIYRRKKNILGIRHVAHHRLVAIIEIVSPGNKSGRKPLASLVRKSADFLNRGVNVSIVDPFPPGRYDPNGVHAAIWDALTELPYVPTAGKPLVTVAYESTLDRVNAYVNPFAVGDSLKDLPVYIAPDDYVDVPLNDTYAETWDAFPAYWKDVLEGRRVHSLTESEA